MTMATNPTPPADATRTGHVAPLCWKYTANGEWKRVPAPWGGDEAWLWFHRNKGRLVFTTHAAIDADERKPSLEVYELLGADPWDMNEPFVAVFEGVHSSVHRDNWPVDRYFLVEEPAVAKLVSDFATLLTFHPIRLAVAGYVVHKPHERRRPKHRRRRLVTAGYH